MEHCKTCTHWLSEPTKHDNFGRPFRGYCLLTESYEEARMYPDSLAIAHGGGCCTTYLVTAETFGCVQWEEREA